MIRFRDRFKLRAHHNAKSSESINPDSHLKRQKTIGYLMIPGTKKANQLT